MEGLQSFGVAYDSQAKVKALVTTVRNSQLTPGQVTLLMEMVAERAPHRELAGAYQILSNEAGPYARLWIEGVTTNLTRTFSSPQATPTVHWSIAFKEVIESIVSAEAPLASAAEGLICAYNNAVANSVESKSGQSPKARKWSQEEVEASLIDVLSKPDQSDRIEAFLDLPICKSLIANHEDPKPEHFQKVYSEEIRGRFENDFSRMLEDLRAFYRTSVVRSLKSADGGSPIAASDALSDFYIKAVQVTNSPEGRIGYRARNLAVPEEVNARLQADRSRLGMVITKPEFSEEGRKAVSLLQSELQKSPVSSSEMDNAVRKASEIMGQAEYLVYLAHDQVERRYIPLGDEVLKLLQGAFALSEGEQHIAV